MKGLLFFYFLLVSWCAAVGQANPTPVYVKDIEPIIRKNCTTCHKPGGMGPFSLQSYEEVIAKGDFIAMLQRLDICLPGRQIQLFKHFEMKKYYRRLKLI